MEQVFEKAVTLVRASTPAAAAAAATAGSDDGSSSITDAEKLRYYGLYKHVVEGPCHHHIGKKPSVFHVVARSKYEAWEACHNYSREQAMLEYVERLAARQDGLGKKCQEFLDEYYQQQKDNNNNDDCTSKEQGTKDTTTIKTTTREASAKKDNDDNNTFHRSGTPHQEQQGLSSEVGDGCSVDFYV